MHNDPILTFLKRPLKPVMLGLTIIMSIIAQANWRGIDRGVTPPLSYLVAILASTAVVTMIVGWAAGKPRLLEFGLLATIAAYTTRAAFIWMVNPWDQAGFFGIAVVVMAGGTYILERGDRIGAEHLHARAKGGK